MALIQWLINALSAIITPITSTPSKSAPKPTKGGVSNAAPTVTTPLISNLSENIKLDIKWTSKTNDGLLGRMILIQDGDLAYNEPCITNLADRIEDGAYFAVVDLSPHLGYRCPHIRVPARDQAAGGDAGLRIHKLNTPSQSLGCISPGEKVDGDAVDDAKDAFNSLMTLLPQDGTEFIIAITTSF